MAVSTPSDRAKSELAARPSTPDELLRDVTPNQPVLLVGPPTFWASTGIDSWIESAGWTSTCAFDLDRACWLASIQKLSLVLVAGDEATVWHTVEALRPLTMAPLVVAATISSSTVVSLVGAGVDAVVDPASGPEEVFARVVALLRRSDHGWASGVRYLQATPPFSHGGAPPFSHGGAPPFSHGGAPPSNHRSGLVVDLWSRECSLDDEPIALSPTEYALLTFLMTHPQEALSSHTIVRRVWGWYTADGKNALRIFVNRVRRKLGDNPRHPEFIASVRGTGYRFVRNVTQLGDDAEPLTEDTDVATLLRSVEDLAVTLQHCATVADASTQLFDALDETGYAEGMAVFRLDANTMHLVRARKMSESWMASVDAGVPLTPTFASAHSVLIGEPVQFGDIRQMAQHFSETARQLADSGFRACLFLPIASGARVWGHLGLARRTPEPFDKTGSAYLRAACTLFALRVSDIDTIDAG